MARVTTVNVSIDLSQPVPELVDIISLVINSHPGQQIEILKQLDQHIGEAIATQELEQQKEES